MAVPAITNTLTMKYLLIIFDGMADEPLSELGGKTPMQAAKTPYMDRLAEMSRIGAARTVSCGDVPGSDVTNMAILGYDPREFYTGRGAIEAASLEIPMETTDAVFRANLVSTDGKVMIDSSAGHVSTQEARELIAVVDQKLSTSRIKFYPGVSYRHIMVWHDGSTGVRCTPPYTFHGELFADKLPEGDGDQKLISMINDSLNADRPHQPTTAKRGPPARQYALVLGREQAAGHTQLLRRLARLERWSRRWTSSGASAGWLA